jgi:predicted transposase YbfD/YdcC
VKSLRKEGEIIAIDGKTLCGSRFQEEGPLHIVSAWAVKNRLTLGQQQVDGKSNEITAIPELLNSLQLQGAIVTIDAMGCQRAIAQKIFDGKGDYCLAVKGNQPSLETGVEEEFEELFESGKASLVERKVLESKQRHGRYEERYYYAIKASRKLKRNSRWPGLKSIGMTVTYQGDNEEELGDGEVRYYVMSFETSVQRFADAVRSHWGIENSLHWVMDVTFCEDQSRIRKDHGAENVSWLRRLAISLLSNETSRKDSIRAKRIRAAYTTDYLETVLKSIPA